MYGLAFLHPARPHPVPEPLDWLPAASLLPANLRLYLSTRGDSSRQGPSTLLQTKGYVIKPVPRLADVDPAGLLTGLLLRRGVRLPDTSVAAVLSKRFACPVSPCMWLPEAGLPVLCFSGVFPPTVTPCAHSRRGVPATHVQYLCPSPIRVACALM